MNRRRRRRDGSLRSIAGEPMLIGAITLLIAVVAVWIVYNADSGLPGVPTYDVRVVLKDAESLGKTGDVRMAGVLIGRVHARHIEVLDDGTTRAVLTLGLYPEIRPLPKAKMGWYCKVSSRRSRARRRSA